MSHPRGRRSRTVSRQTEPGAGAALTLYHESLTRPAGTAERALSSTSKSNLALSGFHRGKPPHGAGDLDVPPLHRGRKQSTHLNVGEERRPCVARHGGEHRPRPGLHDRIASHTTAGSSAHHVGSGNAGPLSARATPATNEQAGASTVTSPKRRPLSDSA